MTIQVKFKWNDDRQAFEIPMVNGEPRCPKGGGTFYYSPDLSRCFVAATKTAESYLSRRKYAKLLGVVKYSPDGIGHYEWSPDEK